MGTADAGAIQVVSNVPLNMRSQVFPWSDRLLIHDDDQLKRWKKHFSVLNRIISAEVITFGWKKETRVEYLEGYLGARCCHEA